MKKLALLLLITIGAINIQAQPQDYTYDAGNWSSPVKDPSVKSNPWIDLTDLTLKQIQEEIKALYSEATQYPDTKHKLEASFPKAARMMHVSSYNTKGTKSELSKIHDIAETVRFDGVSTRGKDVHILNIYMNSITHKSGYLKTGRIKLKKEKVALLMSNYDNSRKLYVLIKHYQNLLNSKE